MSAKKQRFVFMLAIAMISGCVTWRGPRQTVFRGTHRLPTKQAPEAISLKSHAGNKGLARVLVLPFSNLTRNQNYDYLAESLSSAIDAGMASRFEYKRAVIDTQKEFVMRLNQSEDRKRLIEEFSKQYEVDIVISGFYTAHDSQKLLIQTEIYELQSVGNLAVFTEQSKTDSSLFTVSDTIAGRTVEAIVRAKR
jgi:TolB-like protein